MLYNLYKKEQFYTINPLCSCYHQNNTPRERPTPNAYLRFYLMFFYKPSKYLLKINNALQACYTLAGERKTQLAIQLEFMHFLSSSLLYWSIYNIFMLRTNGEYFLIIKKVFLLSIGFLSVTVIYNAMMAITKWKLSTSNQCHFLPLPITLAITDL